MGVLDTLGGLNEEFKENVTEPVVDNEAFSLQDNSRRLIGTLSGADADDPDQFAEQSARTFADINQVIATPGREFGKATEGTPLNNAATDNAAKVGEAGYEILVEDLGAIGYGTLTGANVRTNDPTHATGGYTPGALDTVEVAATIGTGGVGKAVSGAGKAAVKAGPKAAKAATKTASKSDMGAISKLGSRLARAFRGSDEAASATKGASKTADEAAQSGRSAAKATDETVETQSEIAPAFLNRESRLAESLKVPDSLRTTAVGGIDAVKNNPKKSAAAVTTGGIAAALGLGYAPDLPTGYEVVERFDGGAATVIKETDNSESVLGYWLALDNDSGTFTLLNSSGRGTFTVDFPTSRTPTFDSVEQARTAWDSYRAEASNDQSGAPTYPDSQRDGPSQGWGEATVMKPLQSGWYLIEQEHTQQQKFRYLVAGKDSSGNLLYIGASGTVRTDPQTYGSVDKATAAYEQWLDSDSSRSPDTSQDRPTSDDVNQDQSASGGVLGSVGTIVGVGIAAVLLYALYNVIA